MLSVILPGIRTEGWIPFYRSLMESYDDEFELIIIGPKSSPEIAKYKNIRFIEDWGPPMRAMQKGAVEAKGEYITWGADDGIFLPDALNRCVRIMKQGGEKRAITGRWFEHTIDGWHTMMPEAYHTLNCVGQIKSPYFENHWKIFCWAFMKTSYFMYLGGWDCRFQTCPPGQIDLGVRAMRDGCDHIFVDFPVIRCSHQPGASGDHGPIHQAQTYEDEPIFRQMYHDPDCVNRIRIDPQNWTTAPAKWKKRFK